MFHCLLVAVVSSVVLVKWLLTNQCSVEAAAEVLVADSVLISVVSDVLSVLYFLQLNQQWFHLLETVGEC